MPVASGNGFRTCMKAYCSDFGSLPPDQTATIDTEPPIWPKDGAARVPAGPLPVAPLGPPPPPPPPPDAPGDPPDEHAPTTSAAMASPAASRDGPDRRSMEAPSNLARGRVTTPGQRPAAAPDV